jgi:hypothetical protein
VRPGRVKRSKSRYANEVGGYFVIMTTKTSTTRIAVTILGAACALTIPAASAFADTPTPATPGQYFVQSLGDHTKCLTLDGLEAGTTPCATGAVINVDGSSANGFRVEQLVSANPSCLTRAVPDAVRVGAMADMCGGDHQLFRVESRDSKSYTITAPDTSQTLQTDAQGEFHFGPVSGGADEQWVLNPVVG